MKNKISRYLIDIFNSMTNDFQIKMKEDIKWIEQVVLKFKGFSKII